MKQLTKQMVGGVVLAVLAAAPVIAAAQARGEIVRQPAVVAAPVAPVTVTPVSTAGTRGAAPTSIIVVVPAPFPPRPPNFCFRGNSSGVSRC